MEPPCITIDDTQDINLPESVQANPALPVTPQKCTEMIASAVRECVEQKIPVKDLAKKYGVHPSTIHNWVKKANKQVPRKQKKSNISPGKVSTRILNPPPAEARDNAMDKSNFENVFVRNSAKKETDSESKRIKGHSDPSLFHRVALEMQKTEAEMKKVENEWKKKEEEWKAQMKKKDAELENKDNQILELCSELEMEKKTKEEAKKELAKEKEEKNEVQKKLEREKKEHDEAKKELDDIKQIQKQIGDLLSRKRARPTVQEKQESKVEYIEKEDAELKKEPKQNADEEDVNIQSPRYSRSFFQMEAGLLNTQTDDIG